MDRRIESFEEFWPYYLNEHRSPACRALHYVGTIAALATVAAAVAVSPKLLLLIPVVGYGPSWIGHFFIEHNRPASIRYPRWSLRADIKMFGLALTGRLGRHLRAAELTAADRGLDEPLAGTHAVA